MQLVVVVCYRLHNENIFQHYTAINIYIRTYTQILSRNGGNLTSSNACALEIIYSLDIYTLEYQQKYLILLNFAATKTY